RLAWTNDEGGDGGAVTTVTFEEKGGKTLLVLHELYPSKEALDAAGTGAAEAMSETFEQLDELLVTLGATVGRSCRRRSVEQARLVKTVVSNSAFGRGSLSPTYIKPFDVFATGGKTGDWLPG